MTTTEVSDTPRAHRWEAGVILALALVVLVRAGSEIALWVEVSDAPAAGVLSPPRIWVWGPVAFVVAPLAVGALVAALREGRARLVRLFYVVAFLTLVVDLLFLPSTRPPAIVTADLVAHTALEEVAVRVMAHSPTRLPGRAEDLAAMFPRGFSPPYLRHGEPITSWHVVMEAGCDAPVEETRGEPVGTLFYCVDGGRQRGALTWVGTGGRLVGPPAMARGPEGVLVVPLRSLRGPEGEASTPSVPASAPDAPVSAAPTTSSPVPATDRAPRQATD